MYYRIAIPTYDRLNKLLETTLPLLKKHNIPLNRIDIFVENEDQYDLYTEHIQNIKFIITNTEGIGEKRNFIRHYYQVKHLTKYFIQIDDDVEDICDMDKSVDDLNSFIRFAFQETEDRGLNLWGVSNYSNTFFMSRTITTTLKTIAGAFQGVIVDCRKCPLETDFNHGEDVDFTIQHFMRDDGVVRFNNINLKTKYLCNGGINTSYGGLDNRQQDMIMAADRMKEQYGDMVRIDQNKWGVNVRLNHFYKNIPQL